MGLLVPSTDMRRHTRAVTTIEDALDILDSCDVIRLGLYDNERAMPYIVPLNFACTYSSSPEELCIYFHAASEGRKLDLIASHPNLCFSADCDHRARYFSSTNMTMYFRSIFGEGTCSFLENNKDKVEILDLLIERYRPHSLQNHKDDDSEYSQKVLDATVIGKIMVSRISGKVHAPVQ